VPCHIVALTAVLLTLACRETPREQRAPREDRSEPAAAAPIARKPAPTLRARALRPARQPDEQPIDPALVPVEEDFRGEVEQRIDRRSNLELELQRVSRELTKRQ
jgi:hypothetical protein